MMKKVVDLLKNVGLGILVLILIAAIFGGKSNDDKSSSSNSETPAAEATTESKDEKADAKTEKKAESKTEKKTETKTEEKAEEKAEKKEDEGPKIAENAKYKVEIKDCQLVEDYDGAPAIAINYTFTNVSDKSPSSMQMATNITVYQDGVECEDAYFADANSDGYSNKVKAGVSVDVTRAYKLQNTTSDVEVEVGQLFSFSDDLLAYKKFKLS